MNALIPVHRQIQLRPHQVSAEEQLRLRIRSGARRIILVAPTAFGKCLGKGTPILMFDGSIKPVESVAVGDKLMGPDSRPRNVLSICTGTEMLYRVTPNIGEPYIVNESHILSLKMTRGTKSNSSTYRPGSIQNVSVLDYLGRSKTFKHCAKGWRASIDFSPGSLPLPVDPYFLGLWLGDGHSIHTSITTGDVKLEMFCYEYFASQGLRLKSEKNSEASYNVKGLCWGGSRNRLLRAMRELGVIGDKHIPHCYKTASREDRLALLAGILDSDGYLARSKYFDITLKSERLFDDVLFLARSLGFSASKKQTRKTCCNNGKVGDYFRGSIGGDFRQVPFRRLRHRIEYAPPRKDPLMTGITVEPVGEGEYHGFTIDGDRLFLLGDFTVTHNTETSIDLILKNQIKKSRAWFIVDRITLIDQTSERFARYGIDHGVIQADHWLTDPSKPVQVASAQTLGRRKYSDDELPDLIIVDEAHCEYASTLALIERAADAVVIGLTATPFTNGMADHWDALVNGATTNHLLASGWLAPLKIKACVTPDMKGAKKKFTGEYEDEDAGQRGITIIGDVIHTWIQQTRAHFGGPVKTIVFSPSVAHGDELCRQFAAAGYNFQQISYLDASDAERRAKIEEFRKADSAIHGLVSCAVLTKGFDVPDVKCGISCRPYRKSLSSHIQELGRVMRIADGKDFGLWLDHSGNSITFAEETAWLFENGVDDLSTAQKRDSEAREPKEKVRQKYFCGDCGMQMEPHRTACNACGWERPRYGEIQVVDGELIDVDFSLRNAFEPRKGLRADCLKDPRAVWNAALSYCFTNGRRGEDASRKWAYGIWRGIYPASKLPYGLYDAPCDHNRVKLDAWQLVEREVRRFRKGTARKAAA